jgi:activator of HSP90 ATPase
MARPSFSSRSEKNATAWSNKTITDLVMNLAVEDSSGKARISEVAGIEGDVIANQRKGKLIFFYEVVVKLKWKGETADGTAVNGTIDCINLSEENDDDDLEFVTKLTSDETPERRKVKELIRKKGAELFRAQLATWMVKLKKEYAISLIKPQGGGAAKKDPSKAATPAPVKVAAKKFAAESGADSKAPAPKKEESKFVTITAEDEFKCKAVDLFAAICTEEKVQAYTQSECKIDPKVGGEFSLFSGNVTGVFQELEPGKRIKQAWRFKHWPASHFSEVTLTITELEDKCKLELRQTNVPEADKESTKNGWRTHQWERMKAILGFGSGLSFGF